MDGNLTESQRIEREEFARGHIGADEPPVEPRPAATLVLVRAGADDPLEVLLLRRPERARFAAGAYVFAGGVVDPGDARAGLEPRLGPDVTRAELPALTAALREGFEETGLLPADRLPDAAALAEGRRALLAGAVEFGELVERWDLEFRGLRAAYLSRWVTPARLSRRYDARFFVALHRGGEPELAPEELVAWSWLAPAEALRRFEAGDLPMLFPTRKTMEELSAFTDPDQLFGWARERRVSPIRPRLRVEGGVVTPVLADEEVADGGLADADARREGP
ncbi:MAG TPA: NUDIX domain-containing protein [Gemmatimonadota bacterium]|nr:NUDIX domain-containing protein [Gemmatimonadota bacterium]